MQFTAHRTVRTAIAHGAVADGIVDDIAVHRTGPSDHGQPVRAADVAADVGEELVDPHGASPDLWTETSAATGHRPWRPSRTNHPVKGGQGS